MLIRTEWALNYKTGRGEKKMKTKRKDKAKTKRVTEKEIDYQRVEWLQRETDFTFWILGETG